MWGGVHGRYPLCIWDAPPNKILNKSTRLGFPERCHNHCFNFNCFRLSLFILCYVWGCLQLTRILRSSSIKKIKVVFILQEYWVCLPFENNWGGLPFTKKLFWVAGWVAAIITGLSCLHIFQILQINILSLKPFVLNLKQIPSYVGENIGEKLWEGWT